MSGRRELMLSHNNSSLEKSADLLYRHIVHYVDQARSNIKRAIDTEMVKAYWHIGQKIVEEEQAGLERAEYGRSLLMMVAQRLQNAYQKGFSVDNLERARKFYLIYKSEITISATASRKLEEISFAPKLSWSHYVELIRISNAKARKFYEIEASKNNWSIRELRRQIGSLLYDRLARSKNKEQFLELSYKGQAIDTPSDAIRDPLILEFLDLPESHRLIESKLEEALISNLQSFLMELGKGFAFVARQKRLTIDGKHFYADLIFYHTILKCYVVVDIKVNPLTHGDLGQMMLYVNYFDEEIKMDNDNPTIGLVLCTEKSDKMVKYTLGEKSKQIFASQYQFHLPTVEELERELKKEIREIRQQLNVEDASVT